MQMNESHEQLPKAQFSMRESLELGSNVIAESD
jgi:hypothetical protein